VSGPLPDPRWYERFFAGLTLELWRQATPPEETRREVDFAVDCLDLAPGDEVLDLPCGNGRHSLELAARGYPAIGIDLCETYLAEAATLAREHRLAAGFLRLDLRDLPVDSWPRRFAGAICLGNSFGYFDHAESQSFLTRLAASLRPGGHLLLHSAMLAESVLPAFEPRVEIVVGDIVMQAENRYDVLAGRLDTLYRFQRGDLVEERLAHHWIFGVAEIRRLLETAGLRVQGLFGDLDGGAFALGDPDLYLLARRD
jgi:SAM-dependent methyltransferase